MLMGRRVLSRGTAQLFHSALRRSAGALYALEDLEFAQLRTGWQTTHNGYDWTLAEMGMLVSEPDGLRKLSLAARGLDPTLTWDEDEDPDE
eukprot:3372199-Rhodomonas_salina.1